MTIDLGTSCKRRIAIQWGVLLSAGLLSATALAVQPLEIPSQASDASSQMPAPLWRAQWIWLPEAEESDMLLARKSFTLSAKPECATLSITASSQYELFVNGSYMGRGPARCTPHHQSYDVLNIAEALQEGRNVLAIRVHHQRDTISYYEASRAGLLAQLDGAHGIVQTDASWLVAPDEGWQNASPKMARFHLDVCDRMDLRESSGDWKDPDFDADDWMKARVLRREVGWPTPQHNDRPTHLIPPWTSLVQRDLPYLKENRIRAGKPVHVDSIRAPKMGEDWVSASVVHEIRVSGTGGAGDTAEGNDEGECRILVYDMGEVQNGRAFLDISAPSGSVVDIMSAPYLLNGNLKSPIVASTYVDRLVLSGERDRWEAFYLKPTRWLALVFRRLPKAATIFGVGLVRSEYPFERKGAFHLPGDPELQSLWDAAAKTIQVCTTDAYTDNYRERRQYAQTAYYACLGNYCIFGDTALQRRYLRQIAQEQLANGIMPAYAPRHGDDFMVILDSNCFWIRGLHQYLLHSGDKETVTALFPAARKLLDLLSSFTNSDGLIDSPPYPYWLDHALNDRRGANFCLNAHYLGAVEDFAQVLHWLEEPDVELYRKRARQLRAALREQFWVPKKQLFADAVVAGTHSDQFSEQANAMALAMKIADPNQMEAVAAQLCETDEHDFIRRADGIIMVTPAMSYFLHAGLCEAGHANESWDLLRSRFSHMLDPGTNGTLWEEWWLDASGRSGKLRPLVSGRSDAQTESAFPPALFSRYLLGIEPTAPGLRNVVLRFHPNRRLARRKGAIPTVSGLLEVDWEISASEIKVTLQAPPQTTVQLDLASVGSPPRNKISIDGTAPSQDQISNGLLALPSGGCCVRIDRNDLEE